MTARSDGHIERTEPRLLGGTAGGRRIAKDSRRWIGLLAFGIAASLLFSASSLAGSTEFRVIVNKDNPVSSMGSDEISRIFMKKTKSWADGRPILPVDLGGSDEARKAFSLDIHGRSASAVKNNWQRLVFTGRGTPPPELKSEEDVVAYVRFNRGAIGYVSESADISGVRELQVK